VSVKKIESRHTYQVSSNKYLTNDALHRVLPFQGTCPLVADISVYWNRTPTDGGCKWRMRYGENLCTCRGIHWTYKGVITQQECNRFGSGFLTSGDLKSGAASSITAPCWIGDLFDCPDSSCSGPNPHPDCSNDLACGSSRKDCTAHDCQGACTSDLNGNCYCWCSV